MKYTVQITRWEPFSMDIEVEAHSKSAAVAEARRLAKSNNSGIQAEADTNQISKVTIEGVISHA